MLGLLPRAEREASTFLAASQCFLGIAGFRPGLIHTLHVRDVFFLGQSKRYAASSTINRDELQKFAGQVRDCLAKYRGMTTPPSHHVPFDYFDETEPCLTFFMTTASFSRGARDYADSVNMVLAHRDVLAHMLIYWGLGSRSQTLGQYPDTIMTWARSVASGRVFKGP